MKKITAILIALFMAAGIFGSALTAAAGDPIPGVGWHAIAPDSVLPQDRQTEPGLNILRNSNFNTIYGGAVRPRDGYDITVGSWSFTNPRDIDTQDIEIPITAGIRQNWATWEYVDIDDADGRMFETWYAQADKREPVTTGLQVNFNGAALDYQESYLTDALTYSALYQHFLDDRSLINNEDEPDELRDAARARELAPKYFSAWIKPTTDLWIDVGVSHKAGPVKLDSTGTHHVGTGGIYWDLGRKFFAPAGEWTEIGIDEHDNYLPFRSKVLTDNERGTGKWPSAQNSNSYLYGEAGNETTGDILLQKPFRDNYYENLIEAWGALRIYAYCAANSGIAADGTGIGGPHGIGDGESYTITSVNFWSSGDPQEDFVQKMTGIRLFSGATLLADSAGGEGAITLKVGDKLQLSALLLPLQDGQSLVIDPAWTGLDWRSSQSAYVTVTADGLVEVLGVIPDGGTALITCRNPRVNPKNPQTYIARLRITVTDDGEGKPPCGCASLTAGGGSGIWMLPAALIAAALACAAIFTLKRRRAHEI